MVHIIGRAEWGARRANGFGNRAVGRLQKWLHHSVTAQLPVGATVAQERAVMRQLEDIGQSRFGGGVSYTFAIFPSGRIYEGHSINRIGAHTGGHNTAGVGIVLVGNYETNNMTTQQFNAVVGLLRHGVARKWWSDPALTGGHRDVRSTACPGSRAYSRISEINRNARSGSAVATTSPTKTTSGGTMSNVLHDTALKPADTGDPWASPQESFARRVVRGVQRSGRVLHIVRDLRDNLFNKLWRGDTLNARHEGTDYGLPEQNPAQRLTTAAEYARRAVVLGRRNSVKLDNLQAEIADLAAAMRVFAEAQGVDPERVEQAFREAIKGAEITLKFEDDS